MAAVMTEKTQRRDQLRQSTYRSLQKIVEFSHSAVPGTSVPHCTHRLRNQDSC